MAAGKIKPEVQPELLGQKPNAINNKVVFFPSLTMIWFLKQIPGSVVLLLMAKHIIINVNM